MIKNYLNLKVKNINFSIFEINFLERAKLCMKILFYVLLIVSLISYAILFPRDCAINNGLSRFESIGAFFFDIKHWYFFSKLDSEYSSLIPILSYIWLY